MNKRNPYPDFHAIEDHIRRARIERAVVLSGMIVAAIDAAVRGVRAMKASIEANFRRVEAPQRAVEPGALMRRTVPRG